MTIELYNELLKQITQQEKVTQRGVLEIAGSYNLTREEKDKLLKLIHDMLIKLALITEKYY